MTVEYGKLTYLEIKEKLADPFMAIVPTGCTEQQGPHINVDFDTWFVTELSTAAAKLANARYGVKSLVLPTIPFGPTPEHRSYGYGFIDIPQSVYESLIYSVLTSLASQGFNKIVIFRGCGGHLLDDVAQRFNEDSKVKSKLAFHITRSITYGANMQAQIFQADMRTVLQHQSQCINVLKP